MFGPHGKRRGLVLPVAARGTIAPRMARTGWNLVLLALLGGCGSDPAAADPEDPKLEPPLACEEGAGYADPNVEAQYVGPLRARIVDLDGEPPAADILTQVCGVNFGTNVCIYGSVEADGAVRVPTDNDIPKPAFKYGDGLVYGKLAVLLPELSDALDLGTLLLPKLPVDGAPVVAGARAESSGVVLELTAGTVVELDPLFYRTPEEQAFRAVELPANRIPTGVDHGRELEQLFLLAPLDMSFCPAAKIELPNTLGWAAGTKVELLLQGFDIDQQPYAPYGDWAVIGEGVVDPSGNRIVTTSGGIPLLSNVGVRRK
jgi:hypothetical protein